MAMAIDHNSFHPIEYIRKLRNLGITQEVAEAQAEELEHILEVAVHKSRAELKNNDLATKGDLKVIEKDIKSIENNIRDLELKIEKVRYDSLKFTIWTGIGVVVSLGGVLARGFHWW